jgi:drug/metabolite transporter (DMT)-like permease
MYEHPSRVQVTEMRMMKRKTLGILICVVGVIWVFGMPYVAKAFEGSSLAYVLGFGGWLLLAVGCIVYMYGFRHSKGD